MEKRAVSYEVPAELKRHFNEEEVAQLKLHFSMFDVDGGGSIAGDELREVLTGMGLEPTDQQIQDIIREVDKDRSGEIEFNEFVTLMHKVIRSVSFAMDKCHVNYDPSGEHWSNRGRSESSRPSSHGFERCEETRGGGNHSRVASCLCHRM